MAVAVAFDIPDGPPAPALVGRVRSWLRRQGIAEVLSLTSWGGGSGGRGAPDAAYDRAAEEADLYRAVTLLPRLQREACLASREADRSLTGWFAWFVNPRLARLPEWATWQAQVEEEHGRRAKPFELLLDKAAEAIADLLGPDWSVR